MINEAVVIPMADASLPSGGTAGRLHESWVNQAKGEVNNCVKEIYVWQTTSSKNLDQEHVMRYTGVAAF